MRIGFIKQLIKIVEDSNIDEIEIGRFGTRIRISKNLPSKKTTRNKESFETEPDEIIKLTEKPETVEAIETEKDDNLHTINSPMVGTFYRAPAPDAPPYIEVGDKIKKGDVICIIEAMKIMNEIESDISGEVVDVLISNEEPVEYNQGLFKIRKFK